MKLLIMLLSPTSYYSILAILKPFNYFWVLEREDGMVLIGLIWLRIETS
jgi:hypothetical protein